MPRKPVVLFLCTANACRSQMAEAFLREYASDQFEVYSAGTQPAEAIHPLTVFVMAERGIDVIHRQPKAVGQFLGKLSVRHLIIVCHEAEQNCPRIFPGMMHRFFWPFEDPAACGGSEKEKLEKFREVRDQIDKRIADWLKELSVSE